MNTPAIVIPAYNRPAALQRLLQSLAKAWYPDTAVQLIIVIDAGGDQREAVLTIAKAFIWDHGDKQLIVHPTAQGLLGNIYFCGDLTQRYGAIVLLEDDLVVSAAFYHYAMQSVVAYDADSQIGGISLNALWFNGLRQLPFVPYLDASDTFFMQVAWYQGQVYTATQWQAFRQWITTPNALQGALQRMHPLYRNFPETDWFPIKTAWLVDTDRYYVFPRQSLTTNFGETGTHFDKKTAWFQVPLQHARRHYQFGTLEESWAIYDSWQELQPSRLSNRAPHLAGYELTIDLYSTRPQAQIETPYLLSTRPTQDSILSFGAQMWPLEENVLHAVAGDQLHLALTTAFDFSAAADRQVDQRLTSYFNRHRQPSLRKELLFRINKRLQVSQALHLKINKSKQNR